MNVDEPQITNSITNDITNVQPSHRDSKNLLEITGVQSSQTNETALVPSGSGSTGCGGPGAKLDIDQEIITTETSSSIKFRPSLLRPSALSLIACNAASPSTSVDQPGGVRNSPTLVEDINTGGLVGLAGRTEDYKIQTIADDIGASKKDEAGDDQSEDRKEMSGLADARRFMPTAGKITDILNETNNSVTALCANIKIPVTGTTLPIPKFIFGQNLKERVTVSLDSDSIASLEGEESGSEPAGHDESSELLFSNATVVPIRSSKPILSLSQAAQELEEATRANKRKYSEVTLITGEEDEINMLQMNCKLFAFDKVSSSYQERGRGLLRLNDKNGESRLVARAAGTQRLVLNTKVWPGMAVERAGPKSLRLTAQDVQGDVRIFVVQAAQKEIDLLHSLLASRLERIRECQPKKLATEL